MPKIISVEKYQKHAPLDSVDYDLDLSYNPLDQGMDRKAVVSHLQKQYDNHVTGDIHVAYVGNKNFYSAKSIIRDLASTFEVPSSETFAMTKKYDDEMSVDDNIRLYKEVAAYFAKYPEIAELLPKMIGTMSNVSVHAGGIIISDKKYPLNRWCALQRSQEESVVATLFDKDELQNHMGFLKMDILQVSALSQIAYCRHLLNEPREQWYTVYPDDQKVFREIVKKRAHKHVFQFESPLGYRCMKDLRMESIDDLSNASGLMRMLGTEGGRKVYDRYADWSTGAVDWRRALREQIATEKNFKICESVLERTYGIMIYQEQLSKLVEMLSGGKVNFAKANVFRKKFGKLVEKHGLIDAVQGVDERIRAWHKDVMDMLNEYVIPYLGPEELTSAVDEDLPDFLACKIQKKNGKPYLPIPRRGIIAIFVVASTYTFSRLHATAYSMITYNQMYQKVHHPVEFWCSVMFCLGKKTEAGYFVAAAKAESGVGILPPDINKSNSNFSIEDGKIRYGLSAIDGMDSAADDIEIKRNHAGPFTSMANFIDRMRPCRSINKRTLETLINSNAFASICDPRTAWDEIRKIKGWDEENQPVWTEEAMRKREFECLGLNVSFISEAELEAQDYVAIEEIPEGSKARCSLQITKIDSKLTKKGKPYQLLRVVCLNRKTQHNVFAWNELKSIKPGDYRVMTIQKKNDFLSLL